MNRMENVLLHKKDIILNRDKLKSILDSKDMSYILFYEDLVARYGIDLSYKGFMSLLSNRSSWKLLYAYAMVKSLGIDFDDIFELIDIDIDKKIQEKKEWREKYQR